jgi:hypothetical protein
LVLALFAFYVWLLRQVFDIRLSDAGNATGRDALIVIGTLAASFATITLITEAVKRYRTRDQPRLEPVRGPSAKEQRAQLVPTRADRIRKVAAVSISGLILLGVAIVVAVTVWDAAR